MRLPRKHSMSQRAEFQRVRDSGKSKAGRFLIVGTLADDSLPHLMVGIITTKRIGKAHERNLVRRRVRALLQRHGDALADPRRYLVTIPRKGAPDASFAALEKDWLKQARRLGLLIAGPAR
jgi:ribonuclease P protein component